MQPLIHWFGQGSGDPNTLGGKGVGLERLARLGFPIPPGFCLSTTAYHRYLEVHTLHRRITELHAGLPDETARQTLAGLAHAFPFPDDLAMALAAGLETLAQQRAGRSLLAVRSSALGEDAATTSFAGAHETALGVPLHDVDNAIRRCWASLYSARAVAYRRRKGLGFDNAAMAVVVQVLVPAEVSAVAFTRNPVSGQDDEILINATWGLGETIVSGTVTPDTVILEKATLRIRQAEPGTKTVQLVARDGGGTATVPTTKGGFALDDLALTALGELCRQVEEGFGQPMDIEAAFAAGQWYLLQARPITTKRAGT